MSGDRPDVLEETDPGSECLAGLLPQGLEQVTSSVHRERQEVLDHQHAGQGFLAVAE